MLPKLLFLAFILFMASFVSAQAPNIEAGVPQTLARWRAANYSDVRYKLYLTLEKMSPVLKGTMTVSLENKADQIILDWRKIRGKEDLSKITNVFINGKPAFRAVEPPASASGSNNSFKFEEIDEHLIFRDGVAAGENVIKLDFTSPIATSGAAITRYVDKEDGAEYVYSLFVPSDASTAFPVFDQPDLKARFSLAVDVPKGWKVVSNTRDDALIYDSKSKNEFGYKFDGEGHIFDETMPISTYVFAFAAGEFAEFSKRFSEDDTSAKLTRADIRPLGYEPPRPKLWRIYVRKSQAEKFKAHENEVFRLNREAVKYLESYFDYKYPFPKYDLVLIPEFPFGGMEHAGATFLRESSVIFPSEPTANDYISRANLIFHEAAHQWFGDTVTMRWFDDLWLKEGFAEFMAYKTLEKVLPEYNAWKAFYERNKPLAYFTDSTRGTTPIYQEIPNLSAAKSAYGNIVYRKAPAFLRQAEFFWGEDNFQRAVRAFLKKHQFANATWRDLVQEIEEIKIAEVKKGEYYQKLSAADKTALESFSRWSVNEEWAMFWVEKRGAAVYRITPEIFKDNHPDFQQTFAPHGAHTEMNELFSQATTLKDENYNWLQDVKILKVFDNGVRKEERRKIGYRKYAALPDEERKWIEDLKNGKRKQFKFGEKYSKENKPDEKVAPPLNILYVFPNYQDYGYGIFLLDAKSREYILKNIQNEKDAFLRSMMWGSLWDSVREAELDPKDYVELAIKNIAIETDELTTQTILARVSTAMNYYLSDAARDQLAPKVESLLLGGMLKAKTPGQKITFFRAYLNLASSDDAPRMLKRILKSGGQPIELETPGSVAGKMPQLDLPPLKTKDKFDIVTRLLILENRRILGNDEAEKLLAGLEQTETSDDAKRYGYAAGAGVGTKEAKEKYFNDFLSNKNISESWIEAAFVPFNSVRHSELTLPYLEKALAELPNLKRSRKIFFVNGWLGAFIGGQKDEKALQIVNKFLADNPNLDKDLRLKILENVDALERAVKIRAKYGR